METPGLTRAIVALFGGFSVWAAHFGALYGFNALACARGFAGVSIGGMGVVAATAILLTLVAAIALYAVALAGRRTEGSGTDSATPAFIRSVSLGAAMLAALAVAYSTSAALLLPACG